MCFNSESNADRDVSIVAFEVKRFALEVSVHACMYSNFSIATVTKAITTILYSSTNDETKEKCRICNKKKSYSPLSRIGWLL